MDIVENLNSFADFADQHIYDNDLEVDNKIYPRRSFESEFHHQLELQLSDPEKAKRISQSFERHLGPVLSLDERKTLENWLTKNVRFIGTLPFFDYWKGELEISVAKILYDHRDRAAAFFEEMRKAEQPCKFPVMKNPNDPKNIVILTTTSGGGHKSVADALEQILKKFPEKYKVTVIDVADVFKPSDPLYRLAGLSAEEIYDKVYQQRKETELAKKLWELKPKLTHFIEDTSMKDLKDKIRPLNPDLIISTCHFLDRDLELASSLGVPLRFIHCDFELSGGLVSLIAKVNPLAVRLWLPAKDDEMLHPTSTLLKSELVQQLSLTHTEEEIDEIIATRAEAVVDYSGFPVRLSFKKVTDPKVLELTRARCNVPSGSKFVVLQMGKQGVGTLAEIVKVLNENRSTVYDSPVHVAVMCGTNVEMQKELIHYLSTTEKHPQIHFDILPFVQQEQNAGFLSIADAEVMKPGGAATSEALAMAVNTLIYIDPAHPWEGCNRDHMVRHGVGTVIESIETIPQQLKEVLAKPKNTDYQPIDSAVVVPELIDEAIRVFELFKKNIQSQPPLSVGKKKKG